MSTPGIPTVPAVIDALVATIDGISWGDDVPQVAFGWPQDAENRLVTIGGGSGDENPTALGNRRRREDYRIDLAVIVVVPGDTAIEAKDRAWGIWTLIAETLRDPLQLATGCVIANEIDNLSWTPTVEDEGHGHVLTGQIRVTATT